MDRCAVEGDYVTTPEEDAADNAALDAALAEDALSQEPSLSWEEALAKLGIDPAKIDAA